MSWVKLDDSFSEHPKILSASPHAVTLHVRALCWSSRRLTDGYIPSGVLASMASDLSDRWPVNGYPAMPIQIADELVGLMVWEKRKDGWQIHDYLKYNPSKEMVERQRQSDRKRKGFRLDSGRIPTAPDPDPDPLPQKKEKERRAREARSSTSSNGYQPGFLKAWAACPKEMRVGKGAAHDVWVKKGLEPRADEIAASISRWDDEDRWAKGEGGRRLYPHFRTWLHQGRYDDAT